jgi:cytochrome c oxidase assembly protein subunit 11
MAVAFLLGLAVTQPAEAAQSAKPRSVSVRWLGLSPQNLKVTVVPVTPLIDTPLGVTKEARFRFQNRSSRPVSFKAVHAVDPGEADKFLSKTVCFCFTRQTLRPRETKLLPVKYAINAKLPTDISDLVVSYTLVPN